MILNYSSPFLNYRHNLYAPSHHFSLLFVIINFRIFTKADTKFFIRTRRNEKENVTQILKSFIIIKIYNIITMEMCGGQYNGLILIKC